MSEEEKEFIKSLKTQCKGAREIFKDTCCQLPISYIEKIIDIVEKQQKEIEEQQEEIDKLNYKLAGISTISNYNLDVTQFISKDKIREIIKKYSEKEDCTYKEFIDFVEEIKELLEE